ncbi:peroxisomal membrane protein PMP34-like isoform X1 [Amphibalanus amphitrite]|uniref:peroxisomal membrane protein PMP34-like isoform X1 n=1 Tax=Amphibalanus amphitrite TaxID=1232801 RepID=UPI001C910300|nr:peroxisomal membrane protein PMP34-like isoform X1 [Amphibalanus amphitrite]
MADSKPSLFSYSTLVHAIAGATGSSVAMSLTYPLDTVRTRLQLEEGRRADSTLAVLAQLVSQEGVPTLYRGMGPVLESLFCSNFVYFYTFHGLKRLVVGEHSAPKDLLMAMTAGCINVLLTNPLWVANTRMKMEGVAELRSRAGDKRESQERPQSRRYTSLLDAVRRIGCEEGTAALYNGLVPSLLLTSNPAVHFVAYEASKRYLERLHPGVPLSVTQVFLCGAAAKALATLVTYPLQAVQAQLRYVPLRLSFRRARRRRGRRSAPHLSPVPGPPESPARGGQAGGMVRSDGRRELRILRILALLFRRGGLAGGVYKGLEAKMLQTVLTAALMFVLYEKIAQFVFLLLLGRRR